MSEIDESVTVVIPYSEKYTPEHMLEEAVQSVEEQSVQTDILIIKDPSENGPAWARNQGLKKAPSQFVAFLDADDIWLENKLRKQILEMKKTGAGICVEYSGSTFDEFIYDYLFGSVSSLTPSILIDTDKVKTRFEEELSCREDQLFILQAASETGICFCENLVKVRKHDGGFSSTINLQSTYESRQRSLSLIEDRVPEARQYTEEFKIRKIELTYGIQSLIRFQPMDFFRHIVRAYQIAGSKRLMQCVVQETIRLLNTTKWGFS